jgi:hypothetical protein
VRDDEVEAELRTHTQALNALREPNWSKAGDPRAEPGDARRFTTVATDTAQTTVTGSLKGDRQPEPSHYGSFLCCASSVTPHICRCPQVFDRR